MIEIFSNALKHIFLDNSTFLLWIYKNMSSFVDFLTIFWQKSYVTLDETRKRNDKSGTPVRNFKWCRGNLGIQTAVGQMQEIRIASFPSSFAYPISLRIVGVRTCFPRSPRRSLWNTFVTSPDLSIKADPIFERSEVYGMNMHHPSFCHPRSYLYLSLVFV